MANKSAILSVKIVSDAKEFSKGTKTAESGIDKFQKKMDKLTLPATAILAGVAVVGKKFIDLASDAEQMQGGMQAVFGKAAGDVDKFASTSAERLGMNGASYDKLAAQIGTSLKGAGTSTKDLASETDKLISMGADLSSVFGGTGPEAVDAMSSAFRGQFDPLEKYGIIITAAMVSERLKAKGMDKLTGAALAQAKQQEINNMITEQSSQYNGNFAKEADTLAGMQERLTAKVEDLGIKLGSVLLPALTSAAQALSPMVDWLSQNSDMVLKLIGVIAGLAAGILLLNGAIRVYRAVMVAATVAQTAFGAAKGLVTGLQNFQSGFSNASAAASTFSGRMGTVGGAVKSSLVWMGQSTKALVLNTGALIKNGAIAVAGAVKTTALAVAKGVATAAQWAYNVAMMANPLVWVIALVVALIAVIVLIATKTTFFQDVWAKVTAFMTTAIAAVTAWFSAKWSAAMAKVTEMVAKIREFFTLAFNLIKATIAAVIVSVLVTIARVQAKAAQVTAAVKLAFTIALNAVKAVVVRVVASVVSTIAKIQATASRITAAVRTGFSVAFNAVKAFITRSINGIISTFVRFGSRAKQITNAVRSAFSAAFNAVRSIVSGAINGVVSVIGRVRSTASNITNAVRNSFRNAFNAVRSVVTGVIAGVLSTIGRIRSTVSSVANGARSAFSGAFNAMRSIGTGAINAVVSAFSRIGGAVSGAIGKVKNLFNFKPPAWLGKVFGGGGTGMEFVGNIANTGAQFGTGATGGISVGSFAGSSGSTTVNNIQVVVEVAPTADKASIGREIQKALDAYARNNGRSVVAVG